MDAVPPNVTEGLHLLRLASDVVRVAVPNVAACGGPLEVAVEPDPVWGVKVDTLHLAPKPLPLSQARHHLKRITEYHPVRPILVMLVELGPVNTLRQTVEIGE